MTKADWRDLGWILVSIALPFVAMIIPVLGGACEEDRCTAYDRAACGQEWAACASDGGAWGDCEETYCDCLDDRGCRESCDWDQVCADTGADGGS